jgi:hypothetical protein
MLTRQVRPEDAQITELFDTAGLGIELQERSLRVPTRVGRTPRVDFVSRYGDEGRLVAAGIWASTVDDALTRESRASCVRGLARTSACRSLRASGCV